MIVAQGACGLGPCGPPGSLWAGPLWAPLGCIYRVRRKVITGLRCTLFCKVRAEAVAYVPSTVLAYSILFCCESGLVLGLFCPYVSKNGQGPPKNPNGPPKDAPRTRPWAILGAKQPQMSCALQAIQGNIYAIHWQRNATHSNSDIFRLFG